MSGSAYRTAEDGKALAVQGSAVETPLEVVRRADADLLVVHATG